MYECAQLKVGLRPGMVFIFSLRGPLCAGEAFIPSRPGGPSAALCYMARRDVGPRKELVPRPFTPHISASCVPQKGGSMGGHFLLTWWLMHANVAERVAKQRTRAW